MANETKIIRDWSIINDTYFKEFSPVPVNYQMDELRPYYKISEDLYILPLLGSALYDELLVQVNDNDVTELNSTLLLKVYAYEAICITYEALPFIAFHASEVGITKGKSDNSDSVSINDVNFISSRLRDQMDLLSKQLKRFLEENAELYPKYKPDDDKCSCGKDKSNEYPNWNKQVYTTKRRPIDLK